MITLKETKEKIVAESRWWKIHLFDFVDDFRANRNARAVAESFEMSDERIDALLAATAESLCRELNLETPEWLRNVPACRQPYFVSGVENLKATAIVESPLPFRIRKVFVLENFLERI
ncbi:MAG TPA: hypothetical protein VF644_05875 [Pyrinomonadaceae bacterium]|jgi:hypothetical protein